MKFGAMKMAGGGSISVLRKPQKFALSALLVALAAVSCATADAQIMYKYRGDNGEWIFADRPPDDGQIAETRAMRQRVSRPQVTVTHNMVGSEIEFIARNSFHAPMQLALTFDAITGVEFPHPDNSLRWVLPPQSDVLLLGLAVLGTAAVPHVEYHFDYLPGDPVARHRPDGAYRVPFSAGSYFAVTQAYPVAATHRTPDSYYALDVAMPIGTDVVAARGGVVFDVASNNFRGGLDLRRDGQSANIVRVLHDDGTFAIYAHLNWNSIRVRTGDRVQVGDYIADSGNTGFSSGPHLHFAVQRNAGMRVESLPVVFRGPDSGGIVPATGDILTAYR